MQAMDQLEVSIEGIQEGAVEQAQGMDRVTEMGNILLEAVSDVDKAREEVSKESQRALEAALSGRKLLLKPLAAWGNCAWLPSNWRIRYATWVKARRKSVW